MQQLGFTASAAKAYVALLKRHPATGYELAAASGVPRSAIYNVMRRLQSAGLVNGSHGKPTRYVPLPPTQLVELIEGRFKRDVGELTTSLDQMVPQSEAVTTWPIHGYEEMIDRAMSLIDSSEQTIHASLWQPEAERLAGGLRAAAERGVKIVLFSFNPLVDLPGRILSYGISVEALSEYWTPRLILIVDRRCLVVGGGTQLETNRAVITEDEALVEMGMNNLVLDITLYGQRTGTETGEIVTGLTEHLAPVEKLLP